MALTDSQINYATEVLALADADLRRLSRSKNPFDQLNAAAVIRKLFCDSPPVFDVANAKLRIKPRFRVATFEQPWPPGLPEPDLILENCFHPDDCQPHWKVLELDRDRLFARPYGRVNGAPVTVHDLIMYLANSRGGVHLGKPNAEVVDLHATLNELSSQAAHLSSTTERLIGEGVMIQDDVQVGYRFLNHLFRHNGLETMRSGMASITRCLLEGTEQLLSKGPPRHPDPVKLPLT